MEINFYQIDDVLYKAITPLLIKVLEENKKILIYCQEDQTKVEIDNGLWSFSKTKFLPHGIKEDKLSPLEQPIFITNLQQNFNHAQYLLKINQVEEVFLREFEKVFYFFDEENLKLARILWIKYKNQGFSLNFYKKNQKGWEKINI